MKRLLTPVLFLTLLAAIFSACSNSSRLIATGLEIEVTGIESVNGDTAAISWRIKNSNIVPYVFSHLNYKIQLNGATLGIIDEKDALVVPANNAAGRTSKLTGINAAAGRVLSDAAGAGSASYRIDSQFTVLIYDDAVEKIVLGNSGTVPVKNK